MNKIFVSYSRRNKNFAERLARDLSDAGLDVWIDFRQIHGGEMWENEIYRGLQRSEVLVVCLSPDAVASEWVQREVNTAREQKKFIMPIMVVDAFDALKRTSAISWLEQVQYINFVDRYEEAFPELLLALPGKRRIGAFDDVPDEAIPNPFKGLESFQQTDAAFFFGRENLIRKAIKNMQRTDNAHFLSVIGASGSGKSSLVRAGVIPQLRQGVIAGSEKWRLAIFTPGEHPVNALAVRLAPFLESQDANSIERALAESPRALVDITESILRGTSPDVKLLLVIDQFEEVFTRAGDEEAARFLNIIHETATFPEGRCYFIVTMRADFFDHLGRYPQIAELFEQENILIVTEMTTSNLLRAIEGPAQAVGLTYEDGLSARILDDVRRQPGSLPLLQYALKALYDKRDGRKLTHAAYDEIGGVQKALAAHADDVYRAATPLEQDLMRRIFLRIVEVSESGEATRRRITREELQFEGIAPQLVQSVVDKLTAPEARLLIASREITSSDANTAPVTRLEVCHEALIREWGLYQDWIQDNLDDLRTSSEILRQAQDWEQRKRDPSYLLRGARLIQAEEWLTHADANPLQRDFVQASIDARAAEEKRARQQAERELALQRTAANRLRWIAIVLVLALIGAVGLTVFALNERANAEANARAAEENARRAEQNALIAELNANQARSFALSANAERALTNNDGDLALALAVDSALVVQNPPPETRLSLANVAFAPGTRRVLDSGLGVVVNATGLSTDGAWLFTGDDSGVIHVWDALSGAPIKRIPPPISTADTGSEDAIPPQAVTDITVLPDNETLLAVTGAGGFYRINYRTDSYVQVYRDGHTRTINTVRINADGTRALTASVDTTAILWDVSSGTRLMTLRGHRTAVVGAVFDPRAPDSAYSLERNGTLIRWNLKTGTEAQRAALNLTAVTFDLSTDGTRIAVGGTRGALQLWALSDISKSPTLEITFGGLNEETIVRAVTFSPSGDWLASAGTDEAIALWNTTSGERFALFNGHTRDINDLTPNTNGTRLLSASRDGTARLWDLTNAAIVRDFIGHTSNSIGVYMPQGRAIVSGSGDSTLRLWDIASGRTIREWKGHAGAVLALDVPRDGQRIVSAARDNTLRLWTLDSDEPMVLRGHEGAVSAVSLTPDETQALSAGRDGVVIRWDLSTGQEVNRYVRAQRSTSGLFALAVSSDGTRIAAGGDDQVITVWDAASGDVRHTLSGHERSVRALAFSPDGTRLVSGSTNGDIFLWDVASGQLIRAFNGHNRTIQALDFSLDGKTFVSVSVDSTLRVWDVESSFEVRVYTLDERQVTFTSVAFSPNGDTVLTGLSDGRLRLWRLYPSVDALLAWTLGNRYVPSLTCTQREQFRLEPFCTPDQPIIERELPELPPVPTPPPTLLTLAIGDSARVNVTGADNLRLRTSPNLDDSTIVTLMPNGLVVTLIDGPVSNAGFTWWRVRTADGLEGWAVESLMDEVSGSLQTLVPLSAFEGL